MKKTFFLTLAFAFVMTLAAPMQASATSAPMEKLGSGFMDVISSPLELYHTPKAEIDTADHVVVGFTKGVLKAPFHMLKKAGGGLIDIVTFPIE